MRAVLKLALGALVVLSVEGAEAAERRLVRTQQEFRKAVEAAGPGDVIVLANGEWKDFPIVLRGRGAATAPIALTAEEKGRVFITGRSHLRLAGEHLLVSGLVFRNGWTPSGEVIAFRAKKGEVANFSRVTEVVIDGFNNPVRQESDNWVAIYGKGNRFDHNHVSGKGNQGTTLVVIRDKEHGLENRAQIDHNYFGPRPSLGSNGGETIRVGTSHESLSDSFTTIEDNYFEECDGEAEIISIKSGANVVRRNVFFRSQGTLTLRHGNGNLVEQNVFLGGGKAHTGGVRVINRDQVVRNNYMEGLRGSGFTSALTIMNGVPNSPINRYHQVVNARVERNSIIDSAPVHLNAGADAERSAPPLASRFAQNLIVSEGREDVFRIDGDVAGITFAGNVQSPVSQPKLQTGFARRKVELRRAANGLLYPVGRGLEGVGASRDLAPIAKDRTGVRWYPKSRPQAHLSSGRTVQVPAGDDTLSAALRVAEPGDILALAPGHYELDETLVIDKPVTLVGPEAKAGRSPWENGVEISFTRPTLFQIEEGGSLKLTRVSISGAQAPDMTGNAVIRTTAASMIQAYELIIEDSRIGDMTINAAFNVLATSKGAFAKHVRVRNSLFENISGSVLKLDAETDDLGLYGADDVEIAGATFRDVGGEAVSLYRGGTDESTFGPRFVLRDSRLERVGRSPRNTSGASVRLHGTPFATVRGSTFVASAPVKVTHTVGEPQTEIAQNIFDRTPPPEVRELIAKGPHRARLADNTLTPEAR
jgi:poly(beta-D-mannuronate) lyase